VEPAWEAVLMKLTFASFFGLVAGVGLLARPATLHAQTATPAFTNRVLELDGTGGQRELEGSGGAEWAGGARDTERLLPNGGFSP
jgi:hypothetical protein